MPDSIKIESLLGATPEKIIEVAFGSISIGREPENTIVIDSPSVSRVHAIISEAGSQWMMRDLGSTNGSFVNQVRLKESQLKIVRMGDVLSVADFKLRLSEGEGGKSEQADTQSVLVFFGEKFKSEYQFLEQDAVFKVGGANASLILDGEPVSIQQLLITRSSAGLELRVDEPSETILLNGIAVKGVVALSDGDSVGAGAYRIIINDPTSRNSEVREEVHVEQAASNNDSVPVYNQSNLPEHLKKPQEGEPGWESEVARRRSKTGQIMLFEQSGPEETSLSLSRTASGSFGTKTSQEISVAQRFNMPGNNINYGQPKATLGEKLLYLFGALTLILAAALLFYIISKVN